LVAEASSPLTAPFVLPWRPPLAQTCYPGQNRVHFIAAYLLVQCTSRPTTPTQAPAQEIKPSYAAQLHSIGPLPHGFALQACVVLPASCTTWQISPGAHILVPSDGHGKAAQGDVVTDHTDPEHTAIVVPVVLHASYVHDIA
jgi:hypothetical protein